MQVRRVSSMRQGRNFPAVAGLNGQLFAMGGRAPDSTVGRLSSVEVYHVETNQWQPAKPLVINSIFCFLPLILFFVQKQPRSDAAGAALGGKIYVVGGFDRANTPEIYLSTYIRWAALMGQTSSAPVRGSTQGLAGGRRWVGNNQYKMEDEQSCR